MSAQKSKREQERQWLGNKGIGDLEGYFFIGDQNTFANIAARFGTPSFLTDIDRVRANFLRIEDAFQTSYGRMFQINYALKANFVPRIVSTVARFKLAGADCVSPNEVAHAIEQGIPRGRIIFTGTSVSNEELDFLINKGVKINIDSESQLKRLIEIARDYRIRPVSARVNPDMGAGLNPDVITAGVRNEDGIPIKFGTEQAKIEKLVQTASEELGIDTLHFHIGSGWLRDSLGNFRQALRNVLGFYTQFKKYGIRNLDVGGGPGIPYHPTQQEFPWHSYAIIIQEEATKSKATIDKLILEPGRSIVGDTTVLLTRVNTVEEKNGVLHAFVDINMGDLPRPKLYHSYQHILNASNPNGRLREYSVDGNVCETGDVFTQSTWDLKIGGVRLIPEIRERDVLAILDTGAYCDSMASNYCLRPRPRCLISEKGKVSQLGKLETLQDMLTRFS